MNRMRLLTQRPVVGQDVAPEVKLTLFRDLLDATGENPEFSGLLGAIIPLFINKDPSNPVPE